MAKITQVFEVLVDLKLPAVKNVVSQIKDLGDSLTNLFPKNIAKQFTSDLEEAFAAPLVGVKSFEKAAQIQKQSVEKMEAATQDFGDLYDLTNARIRKITDKNNTEFLRLQRTAKEAFNFGDKNNLSQVYVDAGVVIENQTNKAIKNFERIRESSELSTKGVIDTVNRFKSGVSLAFGDGGNAALGLRKAFFGLGDSSNLLAKGLDFLSRKVDAVSAAENKLADFTTDTLVTMRRFTQEIRNSADQYDKVIKQFGLTGTEVSNVKSQLTSLVREQKKVETEFARTGQVGIGAQQRLKTEIDATRKSIDLVRTNLGDMIPDELEKELQAMEKDIDTVERGLKETVVRQNQLTVAVEKAKAKAAEYGDELKNQLGIFGKLKNGILGLIPGFGKAAKGSEELTDGLQKVEKQVTIVTKTVEGFKTILLGAFGGAFLGGLLGNLTGGFSFDSLSVDVDTAARNIVASLGLPIEEVQRFDDLVTQIYGNNFGQNAADIKAAIVPVTQALERQGEVTDELIQKQTENAIRIRDTYGKDYQETVRAAEALVKNLGVSWDEAYDFIAAGMQRGLDVNGDFLDSISEYAPQAADGQLGFEQMFSVIETGLAGAGLGTDKILDGYKEFVSKFTSGDKALKETLGSIGLNYDQLIGKVNSGQITVSDAFQLTIDQLNNIDPIIAKGALPAIAGQWEDLALSTLSGVDIFATGIDEILGSTAKLDTQYTSFGQLASGIWRKIEVAVKPVSDALLKLATKIMPLLDTAISFLVGPIQAVTQRIENFADTLDFSNIGTFAFDSIGEAIATTLETVDSYLADFVANGADWAWNWAVEIYNGLIDAADNLISNAGSYIADTLAFFLEPGSPTEGGPLSTIDKWGTGLLNTFADGFGNFNTSPIKTALEPVRGIFDSTFRGLDKDAQSQLSTALQAASTQLASTGKIGNNAFKLIRSSLGNANKELASYLESNLKTQAATQKVSSIQQELFEARVKGEDTTAIEQRLRNAKAEVAVQNKLTQQKQEELELQEQLSSITSTTPGKSSTQKTIEEELKAVEDKLAIQLVDEEEAQKERLRLYERYAEQALEAGDVDLAKQYSNQAKTIKDSLETQSTDIKETNAETLDSELADLEEQVQLGITTREDAEQQKIRLLRKYANQAREENDKALAARLASEANTIEQSIEDRAQDEKDARLKVREAEKAERTKRKEAEKAERAARKEAEKKTALEIRDDALTVLEQQYTDGLISEEDYTKQKLRIQEKYYASLRKEGKQVPEALIEDIKVLQDRIDSFREANKQKSKEEPIIPNPLPEEVFKDLSERGPKVVGDVAKTLGPLFDKELSISERIKKSFGNIGSTLKSLIIPVFEDIRTFVKELPLEFIFPFSVIVGFFASPIFYGVFERLLDLLFNFPAILRTISSTFGFLRTILFSLTKVILRWSIAGFVVYGILYNWEETIGILKELWEGLQSAIAPFIENLKTFFRIIFESEQTNQIIYNFLMAFSSLGLILTQIAGVFKLVFKKVLKILIVDIIGTLFEFINTTILAFGGIEKFTEGLLDSLLEVSNATFKVTERVAFAISTLFAGDFERSIKNISKVPNIIRDAFSDGLSVKFFSGLLKSLQSAFVSLIPPQILAIIGQFSDSIGELFETLDKEGGIIYEIRNLFYNLYLAVKELWPEILIVAAVLQKALIISVATTVGIWAFWINTVVAAFRSLGDVLPFIEQILAGLIKTITGIVQLFRAFFGIINAIIVGLIDGSLLEGDFSEILKSTELFSEAWRNLFLGVSQIISALLGGIVTLVVSFISNFLDNILFLAEKIFDLFNPQVALRIKEWRTGLNSFKDNAVNSISDMYFDVKDWLFRFADTLVGFGQNLFNTVVGWFRDTSDEVVGNSIVPDMVNAILSWFDFLKEGVGRKTKEFVGNFIEKIKEMPGIIKTELPKLFNQFISNLTSPDFYQQLGLGFLFAFRQAFSIVGKFNFVGNILSGQGIVSAILGKTGLLKPLQKFLAPLGKIGEIAENLGVFKFFDRFKNTAFSLLTRLGPLGKILQFIAGKLGFLAGPLGIVLTIWGNWDLIVATFNTTIGLAQQAFQNFIDKFGGWEQTVQYFTDLWSDFEAIFAQIKETVTKALDQIFQGDFSGAFDTLIVGFGEIDASSVIEKIRTILVNLWDAVIIETLTPAVQEAFTKIYDALPPGLQTFIDNILIKLSELQTWVQNTLIPTITSWGDSFNTGLSPYIQEIKDSFNEWVETIQPKIDNALEKGKEAWSKLTTELEKIWVIIQENLLPPLKELGDALGITSGNTDDTFESFGAFAGFIISTGFDITLWLIAKAVDAIALGFQAFGWALEFASPLINLTTMLVGHFIGQIADVADVVITMATTVWDWFNWLYTELVGESIVPDMVNGIIQWFTDMTTSIPQKITEFVTGLVTKFTELKDLVFERIETAVKLWARTVYNFVQDVGNYIIDLKNNFVTKFQELKDAVVEKILGFTQLGRDIVNNILGGITETWDSVTGFLSENVGGLTNPFGTFQEGTEGIFTSLYDNLVGNSIVPDTTTGIVNEYSQLNTLVIPILTQFAEFNKNVFTAIAGYATQGFQQIQTIWVTGLQQLNTAQTEFIRLSGQDFTRLFQLLIQGWTNVITIFTTYIQAVIQGTSINQQFTTVLMQLPNVASQIATGFRQVSTVFTELITKTQTLATALKQVDAAANSVQVNTESLPGFASGAWSIPEDMVAQIHKGETILPANIAEMFRGMINLIQNTGIGGQGFNFPTGNMPMTANTSNQNIQIMVPVTVHGNPNTQQAQQIGNSVGLGVDKALRGRGL